MKPDPNRLHARDANGAGQEGEDLACLQQIAQGDRAAFERLYRRYYDRLFRFVLRVTGRMNLVEDVINDTMIVIWRKAGEYRAAARYSPALRQMTIMVSLITSSTRFMRPVTRNTNRNSRS